MCGRGFESQQGQYAVQYRQSSECGTHKQGGVGVIKMSNVFGRVAGGAANFFDTFSAPAPDKFGLRIRQPWLLDHFLPRFDGS